MIGAIAATGAERNTITTGIEAWSRLRIMENATAILAASSALSSQPKPRRRNVKPVWRRAHLPVGHEERAALRPATDQ